MNLKALNMNMEDIKSIVNTYMIETYKRFDFVCEKAEGMYYYDEEGNAYLDFYGGIAVNNAGNANPKVVEAVKDQVGDVIHTFNYPYTIPQALLAKKICDTIGMNKIFFQSTGTEANEAMIKLARKYGISHHGPDKYHIITAKKSFHGRTYGAMAATGQTDNAIQVGFKPMLPGFSYGIYNNVESFKDLVTNDTIAIMLEPIQGEGGVIPATQEFMTGIRQLCDEKGLLLLIDEIQTGWCRTGEVMGYMHYDIKPDVVSMAKGMGGGMPIGAICATNEVASAFSMGSHGTTYGGNPVCCAASLAQINELIDRKLADNAREMGNYFINILKELPYVKEVRGKGLLIALELDEDISLQVKEACLKRRLMVTSIGSTIIRMVPPLILEKSHCDEATKILRDAIMDVKKEENAVERKEFASL
jgi:acetylornithine/N-succinyldiaminopimelate aminotransferase